MQIKGRIVKLTITEEKMLSFRIKATEMCTGDVLEELQSLKRIKNERINLVDISKKENNLYFDGEIYSINMTKEITIILHTPMNIALIVKAANMIGTELFIRLTSKTEREISQLLQEIAQKQSRSTEDVLYELTTFTKNGQTLGGKRVVYGLSCAQAKVVLSKLGKLASGVGT